MKLRGHEQREVARRLKAKAKADRKLTKRKAKTEAARDPEERNES
jgi:hypothetical protein